MRFLNRKLAQQHSIEKGDYEAQSPDRPEPQGHIHANYRHWNWFQPTNQRAQ